jgi:hypothetical protein
MPKTGYYIEWNRPTQWLLACMVIYALMNGAQLFETAIIVPAWTRMPPETLQLFHSPYHLDFKSFWIALHSIHEVVFIIALILNWNNKSRRTPLLLLFIAHIVLSLQCINVSTIKNNKQTSYA